MFKIKLDNEFNKLINNIKLTENKKEDGLKKTNNVCEKLSNHYYGINSNYESKMLIMGSVAKETAIMPPTDVDVIFELPFLEKLKYDNYSSNGQSQLLQDVKNILLERYPNTSIRGDGPVVVVDFTSYKIEVNPAIKLGNVYLVPITKDGGKWEEINPIAENKRINVSDSMTNHHTKPLIQMIKHWKNNCSVPIKSFHIELIAVDFMNAKYNYHYNNHYDEIVRDFFNYLINSVNKPKRLPESSNYINYGNKWESKARTAYKHANNAIYFQNANLKLTAIKEWKKIFGSKFG